MDKYQEAVIVVFPGGGNIGILSGYTVAWSGISGLFQYRDYDTTSQ
jgi:hypothetical protein